MRQKNLLYENLQNCNCCPYGYHIDLDFVRYCESLVGGEPPSDGQLLRRDKRRSRKSLEVMLGLDTLCLWEPNDNVKTVKEVPIEIEPESPKIFNNFYNNKLQKFTLNYYNDKYNYDFPQTSLSPSKVTEIPIIIENNNKNANANHLNKDNSSSSPETSAFLHDALDDVVSDFERTLERTSIKKRNKNINIPWEQYIDVFDSCISSNKSTTTNVTKNKRDETKIDNIRENFYESKEKVFHDELQQEQLRRQQKHQEIKEKENGYGEEDEIDSETESISNESTDFIDTNALQNIREQMAKSLNRMKELEEEVKNIPILQRELNLIKGEKQQLEIQLKNEEANTKKLLNQIAITATINKSIPIVPSFNPPQKVNQIGLESLGSRLPNTSPINEDGNRKIIMKRDIGIMCSQHLNTRDAGTLTTSVEKLPSLSPSIRTIGTNPLNTTSIKDRLYTNGEVEDLIKGSLREYEDRKRVLKQRNSITVGTQIASSLQSKPKAQFKSIYVQTNNLIEKIIPKMSQSVMAVPIKKDVYIMVRPETRSIGCSDDKLTTILCDKCTLIKSKRTIGCGPDSEENNKINYLSLKQMDMPSRSLSFSLGDNEKLNIRRKTIGTQYHRDINNIGIQNTPITESIGIQNSVISLTKGCQYIQLNETRSTDTKDLIQMNHKITSTIINEYNDDVVNDNKSKSAVKTMDNCCNTDTIQTREYGTMPTLNLLSSTQLVNAASNTDKIMKKDVRCGNDISNNDDEFKENKNRTTAKAMITSKQHIKIECATNKNNYCDSCKDTIKNLAREFSTLKTTNTLSNGNLISLPPISSTNNSSVISVNHHANSISPGEIGVGGNNNNNISNGTKIPRPTTLTSPRTTRKLFLRQNTYTISSPSPVHEKKTEEIGAVNSETKLLSASLDSVNTSTSATTSSSSSLATVIAYPSTSSTLQTKSYQKNDSDESIKLRNQDKLLSKSYNDQIATSSIKDNFVEHGNCDDDDDDGDRITSTTDKINASMKSQTTMPAVVMKTESYDNDNNDDRISSTTEHQEKDGKQSTNELEQDAEIKTKSNIPVISTAATTGPSRHSQNMLLNKLATSTLEPRTKTTPSKEMKAAMKVINDSLQKSSSKSNNLKNANSIVQNEWFKISSVDQANPMDVEDYLDCFEEYSNALLKHIVNMTDSNGNTAMHYAVSHGNFDVISILLDSKVCNVNQTNNAGYTCVMLVSLAKLRNSAHRTVVQRLFQMADVNIRAKKHCQTALMLAVSHGNLDMVEMLLNAGADINIQDEDGSTALMCAAEHGRIDIVKHLLSQSECDSLIQDVDGSTAFKIAWQAGHRDIGLLLYVHEQMLRSKMPNLKPEQKLCPATPRHQKAHQMHQQQQQQQQQHQQQSHKSHQQHQKQK